MNSLPLAPICFGTGVTCVDSLIRDGCASFADGVCASEDVLLFSLRRLARLDATAYRHAQPNRRLSAPRV